MMRLKELRKSKGLTQQDIADKLKITRAAYTNIENGKRDPDTATLQKLANIFGVTVDYILDRESESVDDETTEILRELKTRPEMKTLFSVSKKASADDIKKAAKILSAMISDDDDEF